MNIPYTVVASESEPDLRLPRVEHKKARRLKIKVGSGAKPIEGKKS